jgi:aliphatic nitrilase
MGDTYPKVKAAVVQAAPVFLDREGTVDKACRFIEEAADSGAKVVVFPEGYIPAFPHWYSFYPTEHSIVMRLYKELFKNAVVVPSPATDRIGEAAKKAKTYVVMGMNEKVADTYGTLYNTAVFFGPNGEILGKRRKLVPSVYERMVHTGGDGSTLDVFGTPYGGLSGLICWENTNPLARFTMLAKGGVIHAAMWPAWGSMAIPGNTMEDMDNRVRFQAYEGRIFVLSSTGVFSEEMKDAMELDEITRKRITDSGGHASIVNPSMQFLAGPGTGQGETLLVAELDMEEVVIGRYRQDITGHYNRFDVFNLTLNRNTHHAINEDYGLEPEGGFCAIDDVENLD